MAAIIENVWGFLGQFTDIWEKFSFIADYKIIIYLVLFGLLLVFGIYLYNILFSFVFFVAFATAVAYFMSKVTTWQNTIALVAVVGVIFAFLLYKAQMLGAIVVNVLLAAAICLFLGFGFWIVIIGMAAALVMTIIFPVYTTCIVTAAFGAFGLASLFDLHIWVMCVFGGVGIVIQLISSRNKRIGDRR
ncbi:MAG: hypothetical protein E7242_10390 [Lachnospiraceae bacterium]|nr:hypothetical protein [Lachnospiraceae bacterium]